MPLIDSLARFYLHLVSLPEAHYAGICESSTNCPVAYWLMCETGEWIHVRVSPRSYSTTRYGMDIVPLWVTLFVAFVDARRWRNGRYMSREECLYALEYVERELSRRLLPERAASRVEREYAIAKRLIDHFQGRIYAIHSPEISEELAIHSTRA